ncbi:GH25 family lysozyme [Streptomyces sp. NPDC060000]|uniref:GH25 family lysozyme n=1 Tax=Streptomyces sp. NPDC060000 TaxID=3347031 RepID=UPI0036A08F9F
MRAAVPGESWLAPTIRRRVATAAPGRPAPWCRPRSAPRSLRRPPGAAVPPRGHDVSSHRKTVDRPRAKAVGARFVHVRATEGTAHRNPRSGARYDGAAAAGLFHGSYHFALPDGGSGKARAAHFVHNGGHWNAGGRALPPALDIEYDPYDSGRPCYGPTKAKTVARTGLSATSVHRPTGGARRSARRPTGGTSARAAAAPSPRITPCGSPVTRRPTWESRPPDGPPGPSGGTPTAAIRRVTRISFTAPRASCRGSPTPGDRPTPARSPAARRGTPSNPRVQTPGCPSQFIFRSPRLLTVNQPMTSNDCLGKWKTSR